MNNPELTLGEILIAALDDDMFGWNLERFIKTDDAGFVYNLRKRFPGGRQ